MFLLIGMLCSPSPSGRLGCSWHSPLRRVHQASDGYGYPQAMKLAM